MLIFRLYHTLHLQFFELFQSLNGGFEASGLYGLCGNKIVIQGNNQRMLSFCFETGALENGLLNEKESMPTENYEVLEIRPETDMAEMIKFLFAILRRSFGVEPYADNYMLNALCKKLNRRLIRYNGHCFLEIGEAIAFSASDNIKKITIENLAEKLMEVNRDITANEVYEWYENGKKERKFCRFDTAETFLKKVLSAERKNSILYQETCFELGEVFYFMGKLDEAVECYLCCNPKLLDKGEELFLRLGYCLAEKRKASEKVTFYTKCRLNGRYMAGHKDKLEHEEIPAEEFEEYTKLCEKLGALEWKQKSTVHE